MYIVTGFSIPIIKAPTETRRKWETYTSTRSTLTPQGSVASSRIVCIIPAISFRSVRISSSFLVPKMLLMPCPSM